MKSFGTSKEFIFGDDLAWETVGEGLKRKIMGYDDKIMLVKVDFQVGAVGSLHEHHHSQVTYVESGAFDFTIGGVPKRSLVEIRFTFLHMYCMVRSVQKQEY